MAFLNGPRIVTDGLVLSLDAADRNSYVSGSTIWNDVSGNSNSGSLVNGPTFNSGSGGSIVFDGTDDYVTCGTSTLSDGSISIFAYVYPTSFNSTWNIIATKWFSSNDFHWALKSSAANGTNLRQNLYTTSNSDIYGTTAFSTNNWYYVGFTLINGGLLTFYKNGIADGTSSGVSRTPQNNVLLIDDNRSGFGLKGRISNVQIYNRALSAQEILQNYNAQKSRFGL